MGRGAGGGRGGGRGERGGGAPRRGGGRGGGVGGGGGAPAPGHAARRPHPAPPPAGPGAARARGRGGRDGPLRGRRTGRHTRAGGRLLPRRRRPPRRLDPGGARGGSGAMTPVHIATLGCKGNAYDSATMADRLRAAGCEIVA